MSDAPQGPGWWMATDGKWYPPSNAPHHGSDGTDQQRFAPPVDPAAGAERAAPHRRRNLLILSGALAAMVVAVVVAIVVVVTAGDATSDDAISGDDGSETAADSSSGDPAGATDASDNTGDGDSEADTDGAAEAFDALLAGHGETRAADMVEANGVLSGFAAFSDENVVDAPTGTIRRWDWDGAAWTERPLITTALPVDSWQVVDVTGDGVDDLVFVLLANTIGGGVLTAHSGEWTTPGFDEGYGVYSYASEGLVAIESALWSEVDPCDPVCKTGNYELFHWRYSEDRGLFLEDRSLGPVASDLLVLRAATGRTWTEDELYVLGNSYCNDWEPDPASYGDGYMISEQGKEDWAHHLAGELDVNVDVARAAIDTDVHEDYRPCQ